MTKMLFVILTLSFTLGALLASAVSVFILFKLMASPKFVKWYLKWFMGIMKKYEEMSDEFEELL